MTKPPPSPTDNLADVPTAAEYKAAFLQCRPAMRGKRYLDMLRAHYRAEGHTITPDELAGAVDFDTYNQANLQYGKYAKELGKVLNRTPKYNVAILATFSAGEEPGEQHIRWTMIPQVATALEELGWVGRA